jgi:hypothetical protein
MRMNQTGDYKIECPVGYPYILFAHDIGFEGAGGTQFFLATSLKVARLGVVEYDTIIPVSMGSLWDITCGCRNEILTFLRQFGQSWIQREAMIFFKEGSLRNGSGEH